MDGKTATVDILAEGGFVAIRTNGKTDAAIQMDAGRPSPDELTMAMLAMMPLAYQPEAKTAALIGFGSGMSTDIMLRSPHIERVDTIEIEPAMVDAAHAFLPRVQGAYSDPRSHIVFDDAKSYFARGRKRYDIIVSEPSNPWVSGVASLFTEEFYRRLATSLNEGGVLSQWLHTYEMDAVGPLGVGLQRGREDLPAVRGLHRRTTGTSSWSRGKGGRDRARWIPQRALLADDAARSSSGCPDRRSRRTPPRTPTWLCGRACSRSSADARRAGELRLSARCSSSARRSTRFTQERVSELVGAAGGREPAAPWRCSTASSAQPDRSQGSNRSLSGGFGSRGCSMRGAFHDRRPRPRFRTVPGPGARRSFAVRARGAPHRPLGGELPGQRLVRSAPALAR